MSMWMPSKNSLLCQWIHTSSGSCQEDSFTNPLGSICTYGRKFTQETKKGPWHNVSLEDRDMVMGYLWELLQLYRDKWAGIP